MYSGSSGDVNQSWINCQALPYGFGSGSASRLHHEFCLHPELNQALKQQRENRRTETAQRTSKQHGFLGTSPSTGRTPHSLSACAAALAQAPRTAAGTTLCSRACAGHGAAGSRAHRGQQHGDGCSAADVNPSQHTRHGQQ